MRCSAIEGEKKSLELEDFWMEGLKDLPKWGQSWVHFGEIIPTIFAHATPILGGIPTFWNGYPLWTKAWKWNNPDFQSHCDDCQYYFRIGNAIVPAIENPGNGTNPCKMPIQTFWCSCKGHEISPGSRNRWPPKHMYSVKRSLTPKKPEGRDTPSVHRNQ